MLGTFVCYVFAVFVAAAISIGDLTWNDKRNQRSAQICKHEHSMIELGEYERTASYCLEMENRMYHCFNIRVSIF